MGVAVKLELSGPLADHVASLTGEDGLYQDAEEYLRHLIRRDLDLASTAVALEKELIEAFAQPVGSGRVVSAADVIARGGKPTRVEPRFA